MAPQQSLPHGKPALGGTARPGEMGERREEQGQSQ